VDTPTEITAMDRVIAYITEEPVRPGSDDGSLDIWNQAELHFQGHEYIIVAQPSGFDSETCSLYRVEDDGAVREIPFTDKRTYGDMTVIPALCALAFADAEIRVDREDYVVKYYRDNPMRVHADLVEKPCES
jgi:hypothetical protein